MRWWPPVGVVTMLLLGLAVGKDSTPVDTWVFHCVRHVLSPHLRYLLLFTTLLLSTAWWMLGLALLVCVGVALYRGHRRMALVVLLCPLFSIMITEVLKRLYNRHNGPDFPLYPSGHTASIISVTGMVALVAGYRLWALAVAIAVSLLGALGLIAFGYHYFTDTVGAALLTTALVCLATRFAGGMPTDRGSPRGGGASAPHRPRRRNRPCAQVNDDGIP